MFAKSIWFRPKRTKRGITPACWQGWAFLAAWGAIAAIPAMLLLTRGQGWEALAWLAVMSSLLAYDLWHVRRTIAGYSPTRTAAEDPVTATQVTQPPRGDEGIYFLDDNQGNRPVNTARFHLSLKQ